MTLRLVRNITGPWRLEVSLVISVMSLTVVSISTWLTATTVIGSRVGFYSLFGIHWRQFLYAHWLVLGVVFAVLIILADTDSLRAASIKAAQVTAVFAVLVMCYEVSVVIPNGARSLAL